MRLFKHVTPKLLLLSLSLVLINSSCNLENVTVQEAEFVTATGGTLSAGCDVTHLISANYSFLSEDNCLAFLQLQTHPDPTNPTNTIVDHYAAISLSLNDFTTLKTELETICRDLGSNCSYALSTTIAGMNKQIAHVTNRGMQ